MIAAARLAAFDVLRRVAAGTTDLGSALAQARGQLPDERDRALAGEIAVGTLRWQGAFDALITAYTGRPLSRLDGEVLIILRLTAFQLLHMDRIPASAAVNDAVQLTRKFRKTSAAGLVNAVLRRISRERDRLPLPPRPVDSSSRDAALDYLSVTLSHPRWLVQRWLDRAGFEAAEGWARFNNAPAALTLRANTLRATRDQLADALRDHGVETSPTRYAPSGLVVERGNPLLTPLAREGLFVVQDEASQLIAVLANAQPGERVLDACAAPGGKTTAMAAQMAGRGFVAAMDVRSRRVDLLANTVRRAGAMRVGIVHGDAAAPLPFADVFDCVLLDAPCSGLGTVRRDPDIKWRRDESDLPLLAAVQRRMLDHASRVIRTRGRLVYATCSSEPDENERVVEAFLGDHADFRLAPADELPTHVQPFAGPAGWLHTLPFRHGLEAFFGAVLVKA